jgi:hypothetical protein
MQEVRQGLPDFAGVTFIPHRIDMNHLDIETNVSNNQSKNDCGSFRPSRDSSIARASSTVPVILDLDIGWFYSIRLNRHLL